MASLTLRSGTQSSLSAQFNRALNGTVVTFIRVHSWFKKPPVIGEFIEITKRTKSFYSNTFIIYGFPFFPSVKSNYRQLLV